MERILDTKFSEDTCIADTEIGPGFNIQKGISIHIDGEFVGEVVGVNAKDMTVKKLEKLIDTYFYV